MVKPTSLYVKKSDFFIHFLFVNCSVKSSSMKSIFTVLILFATLVVRSQSYEMVAKDTINLTDANNKRQGQWIVMGKLKKGCYQPEQVAEKGIYNDNKRVGTWIE